MPNKKFKHGPAYFYILERNPDCVHHKATGKRTLNIYEMQVKSKLWKGKVAGGRGGGVNWEKEKAFFLFALYIIFVGASD